VYIRVNSRPTFLICVLLRKSAAKTAILEPLCGSQCRLPIYEIFNETNRDEVTRDLLGWLERAIPSPVIKNLLDNIP
jgi:hypothetical protein